MTQKDEIMQMLDTLEPHAPDWIKRIRKYILDLSTQKTEENLIDLLCLADELLMGAKKAFPLPGDPLRDAYIKIRDVTGQDYHERKNRARKVIRIPEIGL